MSNEGALVSLANQNKSLTIGAEAAVARAVAEVQARLVIGQQFPRDERKAIERIVNACTRFRLAEKATYQYAKGGTNILGASIRLAEAIAQYWGNLDFGWREVEQKDGISTCEAYAHDVQTNTRRVMEFKVPLTRYTKQGMKRLTDPRDIYEMVANQAARRVRACILAVVPGDVVEEALDQCDKTLRCNEDVTPEGIKRMVEAFAEVGVTKAQIVKRIQRDVEAITPALKVNLRNIYNAIKDGIGKPDEYFDSDDVEEPAKKPQPPETRQKPKASKPKDSKPAKEEPPVEKKAEKPSSEKAELVAAVDEVLQGMGEEELTYWLSKIEENFGSQAYINFDEETLKDLTEFLAYKDGDAE